MGRNKRTFTGDFKLKVAYEALAGEKTIQEIAASSTYSSAIIGYIIKMTEKVLREIFRYNSRITVNIDRLRKNSGYRGEADEEKMYIAFRETIYTYEFQDYIRNIVRIYIKDKENHQF
ncbi:hypothetical protein [uncultured Sphaerochaeta sp.]|uniref:hypothetical protein n=1 Tax=uncultured Sphaerochaeta sp. TaxID=886478 RepID=UPI002A0A20BD|nr:hypothetical protein [uncultured Sphaerochaeta sp.]